MRTDGSRKSPRLYEITGALIGATVGGAFTDSFLGIFSIAVFAVVGATIGAVARGKGSGNERW